MIQSWRLQTLESRAATGCQPVRNRTICLAENKLVPRHTMRHHPRFVLYPISSFSLPDFELLSKQIKKPEMAELNCFAAVVLDEIVSHKQKGKVD